MNHIPEKCNDCGYCVSNISATQFKCTHEHGKELNLIYPNEQRRDCPIKDDKLPGKRFRVKYREESLYITVVIREGVPFEIFADHATSGDPQLYYMMSSLDTITRLATMALKKYPIQKVVNQMSRSSRTKLDFPGILSKILEEWC